MGTYLLPSDRVSLLEKDIEEYLFLNPSSIYFGESVDVDRWVKRQFRMPSGILDLVGVTSQGDYVVVEVKNVAIDSSSLTQVCRYAYDFRLIISMMIKEKGSDLLGNTQVVPKVYRVVIGKSIDEKTLREAEALGIIVNTFSVRLDLSVNSVTWDEQFHSYRETQYRSAINDLEMGV